QTAPPFQFSSAVRKLIRLQRDGKRVFDAALTSALDALLEPQNIGAVLLATAAVMLSDVALPTWSRTVRATESGEDEAAIGAYADDALDSTAERKRTAAPVSGKETVPQWTLRSYVSRFEPLEDDSQGAQKAEIVSDIAMVEQPGVETDAELHQ